MTKPKDTVVVHQIPVEDTAFAIVYSSVFDVVILGEESSHHMVLDRSDFYSLIDEFTSDESMIGLMVNAYSPAETESGLFAMHFKVTKTDQEDILNWEQTILDHERTEYIPSLYMKPRGELRLHAPGSLS